MEQKLPLILTVKEVQGLLRLKRSSIYRMLKLGLLPSFRLGKRIFIYSEDIVKLIAGRDKTEQG